MSFGGEKQRILSNFKIFYLKPSKNISTVLKVQAFFGFGRTFFLMWP